MTELKEMLDDAAGRAKIYEVAGAAWQIGRHKRRFRAGAVTGAFALTLAAVAVAVSVLVKPAVTTTLPPSASASAPPAIPVCVATRLSTPEGYPEKTDLTAFDSSGRFVAGRVTKLDGQFRLLVWDNGRLSTLELDRDKKRITGISPDGTIVINGMVGKAPASWVFRNGQITQLKGENATAADIDASGIIFGSVRHGSAQSIPVVWRTADADPVSLPLPADGWQIFPFGLDDEGFAMAAGYAPGSSQLQTLFWAAADGKRVEVPALDGQVVRPMSLASGRAVVRMASSSGEMLDHWVDLRTASVTVIPGAVPDSGRIIAPNGSMAFKDGGLFYLLAGNRIALPSPPDITPDYGLGDTAPRWISKDGKVIVGRLAYGASAESRNLVPVVWRCS